MTILACGFSTHYSPCTTLKKMGLLCSSIIVFGVSTKWQHKAICTRLKLAFAQPYYNVVVSTFSYENVSLWHSQLHTLYLPLRVLCGNRHLCYSTELEEEN